MSALQLGEHVFRLFEETCDETCLRDSNRIVTMVEESNSDLLCIAHLVMLLLYLLSGTVQKSLWALRLAWPDSD